MHSLLDDAFALVSPSSQGSAGVTGISPALPSPSPQNRSARQWGSSSYPAVPTHSPFSAVSLTPGDTVNPVVVVPPSTPL